MGYEIERRFLVHDTAFLAGRTGERIVQGYVAKETGAMMVRVRIRGDAGYLTLKGPCSGLRRDEFEYRVPLADASRILADHCAGRHVRKTRFAVKYGGHVFEVDVFEGRHAGLVIAEVELKRETESVALPPWLGAEVTHDRRYGNFALAQLEGARPPADSRPRAVSLSLVRPGVAPDIAH